MLDTLQRAKLRCTYDDNSHATHGHGIPGVPFFLAILCQRVCATPRFVILSKARQDKWNWSEMCGVQGNGM